MANLIITNDAQADIISAFNWYNSQASLGDDFLESLDNQLTFIQNNPEARQAIDLDIRRAVLTRFPYNIYYRFFENTVYVLAVWHGKRDLSPLLNNL